LLEELKKQVCLMNKRIHREGLVRWTMGNVSGRDRERGVVAIKPSGVEFEDLTAEMMVLVNLEGRVVRGAIAFGGHAYASGDLRARTDVGGSRIRTRTMRQRLRRWGDRSRRCDRDRG